MSVIVEKQIDAIKMDELQDLGFTSLKLYYASSPDGEFLDSGTASDPVSLAAAVTLGEPYRFTWSFAGGNPAMWFKVVPFDGAATGDLRDSEMFHGGGGTTLQRIRQRLGKETKVMLAGTATSNGLVDGSTVVCDHVRFRRYRNDYFGGISGVDGQILYRPSTKEWGLITDFDNAGATFTVSPAFATQVMTGETFEVWARWDPEIIHDAINWAIENVFPVLSKPVIDTSIITEDDVFQYPIPNSIRILNRVEIETDFMTTESTDQKTRGHPWRRQAHTEIDDGLNRLVEFKREFTPDRRLRFIGTTMLSRLYNETDYAEVIEPQSDLIVYLAAHHLYDGLMEDAPSSDVARYRERATYWMNKYLDSKRSFGSRRMPKALWGHQAIWTVKA